MQSGALSSDESFVEWKGGREGATMPARTVDINGRLRAIRDGGMCPYFIAQMSS